MVGKTYFLSLALTLSWIALIPIFSLVFHVDNLWIFLSIAPVITLGIFTAANRGYLQGSFSFASAAIIIFSEALSKLSIAVGLVAFGLKNLAYLSIPLSIVVSFVVALFIILLRRESNKPVSYKYLFPKRLLFATFLTVFGSTAFLSVDLLLARHFLTTSESGAYSLLSLVGKMIYFFGSLLNVFILTLAARDTGLNKNSLANFYKIIFVNFILLLIGFLGLGIFGSDLVPILFGEKSRAIVAYLSYYALAIFMFTIATSFATYHLAKQQFIFAYNGILAIIIFVFGIFVWHKNISEFVDVMLASTYIYLASTALLHVFYKDISEYFDEEDKEKFSRFKNILQDKISVSICVPAYNEEKNIGKLVNALLTQKTKRVNINKIVVVSSASTDSTDSIVKKIVDKNPDRVVLVQEKERRGKAAAINSFLQRVDDPIVIVQSADTLPVKNTIENLCLPFLVDGNIGMTGGSPYPVNDPNSFLGFVIHTWWWFHRHIPRFGEIIAFRNVIPSVSKRTAVDEAYIQAKFAQLGYKIVHVPEAKIYNKGAETLSDIIKQRRRIFNGHVRLLKEEHVHISDLSKSGIKLLLFDYKMYSFPQLLWLFGGMMIEIWANVLGNYDKYVNDENPVTWEIATTTKNLSGVKGGLRE